MDEFDDNGWNEIWEVFGKDPNPDENEDDNVEDQFWFEEIPDESQFTSTWSEGPNGDGKQFTSHEEIEVRDEHPVDDPIHNKFVGPECHKECQSEIHEEYNSDEAISEYDPAGKKFTGDANHEIIKDQNQDDTENDPIGQKFTGDASDEKIKDQNQDDTENDPIGQKFTGDANHEIIKDQNQDDTENDQIGQKFTGGANHEIIKDQNQDDTEDYPIGQKFTGDVNDGMMKEWNQDDDEHHAGNECNSNDKVYIDQNIVGLTPAEVEADISITENVLADSCDLLPAERLKHRSYKILQCNKSSDRERETSLGISRYKVIFVGSLFTGTLIEKWKASSFKLSFQTAFLFAGLFSSISGIHGENVSPQNTFAAIGATVRFNCSWDLKKPVYWEWTPVNSKTGVFLYIGNGGLVDSADDRITIGIDKDQGRYDLVITGVLMKHAGTYNCIENSGLGKSISAELITLDDWNCNMDTPPGGFMGENVVNIPEDSILASCSLHFSGNKDPAIRWGLSKNVSHKNATMTINSASTIVSVFSMRPLKDLDKSVIIADVEGSGESSLTEGVQSWRSAMLSVNYVHLVEGPQRVYVEGDKNVLCNPKCSFQIINAYHGAIYRHAGREYQIPLTFDDDSHVPEGESKWLIMLILSVVFFAGSLVLLLFFVICSRFKVGNAVCAKDGSIKTSDTQTSMESEGFLKV